MSDFIYHKLTDSEKQDIKKQTKNIIEDFSKKLAIIKKTTKESFIERKEMERIEENENKLDKDFKKIMFKNAPNKDEDFIIVEKKQW